MPETTMTMGAGTPGGPRHHLKRRFVSGGLWTLLAKGIGGLSLLAIGVLLARLLPPEQLGSYFLSFSVVSVVAIASQFGLAHTVVKLVGELVGSGKPGQARATIYCCVALTITGALLVAGLMGGTVVPWLGREVFQAQHIPQVALWIAAWAALLAVQSVAAESFRGLHQLGWSALFGGQQVGVVVPLLVVLCFGAIWWLVGESNLVQVISISTMIIGVTTLAALLLLYGKASHLRGPHQSSCARVLALAPAMWVTAVTLFLITQVDLWIMGIFEIEEQVARYGAAARLAPFVAFPLVVMHAATAASVAELQAQGRMQTLQRILQSLTAVAFVPALLLCLLFIVAGDELLGFLFGGYYQVAWPVLAILAVSYLIQVWTGPCGITLMMSGHQTVYMWITLLAASVSVVLATLWIRIHGGTGVAVAMAAGSTIQCGLAWGMARRRLGIWTHASWKGLLDLRRQLGWPGS